METPPARRDARRLHEAAWPDMFANLQAAYASLTQTQFELEHRATELEAARDLFQLVIESLSEALVLIDRTGRVIQTNPAASALLGAPGTQLLGRPFAEICNTPAIPATPWQLLERSPEGRLRDLEVDLPTISGAVIPVLASCGLIRDKETRIIGMLFVAWDITARRQAADTLAQQARELARSNAELEQFAYVASHDLQEPLRMMASFSSLLGRRYQGRLDEDADEFLGYIIDGATRMQRLINDLLAYSRISSQARPLGPVSGAAVLQAVRFNLGAAFEESQAILTVDPLPDLLGDESQLIRLFQNLIGNAIKFRHRDRPPVVQVGVQRQDAEWLFTIRDNGIGLGAQYAEQIFLIFQRLHTRDEYPGTGIGLAVCKKIVERHGGRIWVESTPGQGSTFYFTLPVPPKEQL